MNRPAVSLSPGGGSAIDASSLPPSDASRFTDRGVEASVIHWQHFQVTYDYPVAFTRELLSPDNPLLAEVVARREPEQRHRCLVYVDAGVAAAWPDLARRLARYFEAHAARMTLIAPPITVAAGEAIKASLATVESRLDELRQHAVDRHAYVIAIGGGAVLDAVGLAAAVAHRGVRLIRLPTTVLAQNDSGVGVKNAVNFRGTKNFTGTFAPPWAVLNDLDFLATLPRRQRLAGIAEAIKVALIRDADFFDWLEANAEALATFDPRAEAYMIQRSAELHLHQIGHAGDPFEQGSSRPLDFGHWSAHKLEALTHHGVSHGEAVAIGIALDTRYSVLAGHLPASGERRVMQLLERLGLPRYHPQLLELDALGQPALLAGLREFQEHLGGELTVTLLAAVGRAVDVHSMDHALVVSAIEWLHTEAAHHAAA
ncbi:3-dehydroquinate synthase [Salinicola endophyticus]|uniref:3-dehydroquinate synthase n=1 Tax=Salinicola endophyticus TaxID=1949083 RepID=A0ABY8FBV4_9GAMM|nr:3-dehydroquinate synthase [Salinicola endophyticus]WFF40291.1 3-dehydroquinate synthase [Salinicola endophyticus]